MRLLLMITYISSIFAISDIKCDDIKALYQGVGPFSHPACCDANAVTSVPRESLPCASEWDTLRAELAELRQDFDAAMTLIQTLHPGVVNASEFSQSLAASPPPAEDKEDDNDNDDCDICADLPSSPPSMQQTVEDPPPPPAKEPCNMCSPPPPSDGMSQTIEDSPPPPAKDSDKCSICNYNRR